MLKGQVTVVIPVYNASPYLKDLFVSLSKQSLQCYRLLIVYDKSQDNTKELLDQYAKAFLKKDQFIILDKPIKEGVGKARDFALDSGLILSKYVLFLDCDDSFSPFYFEKLVQKAEQTNADITMCGYKRINGLNGRVISTEMIHNPENEISSNSFIVPYLNPAPWNKLYRMDKIKDSRFVYRGGGEDEMFFLEVLPNCSRIAFVNEPLYEYRLNPGSVLSGTDCALYEQAKEGYQSVVTFYRNHIGNYDSFSSLMKASVFVRFGIGMTTRTCLCSPKDKKNIINESRKFFDLALSGWQKNCYLSFSACLKNGLKSLLIWRCKLLYQLNCFGLFVLEYRLFTAVFKKDIKW